MKKLSKEEMKKVIGGYMQPPPPGDDGGTCCNCFCGPNAGCYGICKFCNPASGAVGPHGETSLCSKIRETPE